MSNNAEWLAGLSAGSEVAIMGRVVQRIETVDRVTKTQIVVGNSKYRVADGSLIGGSSWDCVRILPVTQEIRDAVELRHLRYVTGKYAESENANLHVMRAMWKARDTQP